MLGLVMGCVREGVMLERGGGSALTHAKQTAVPTRGGVKSALAPLHRKTIDPTKPLLEIRGLRKSFGGIQAVRGIDLDVMAGSNVGLIGPNGARKTNFFNPITRPPQPDGCTPRTPRDGVAR